MQYRNDRYGNPLSILGYGCMRFPQTAGKIDLKETEKQLVFAINNGVNYFDTAYIYPGSETTLGTILAKTHLREKVYIATKLPHYLVKSRASLDKYFDEQLKRLKTDYIDFYLLHMLTDVNAFHRMCDLGLLEWLTQKKEEGAIRQFGFSYHGNTDTFKELLDAYDWDFCQIQYNYMDERSQAGREGLHYAASKGIPVVIMEPLRGGRLVAKLPKEAKDLFDAHPTKRSPAEWALRWLWVQPEVTTVLSGMSTMADIQDNISTADSVEATGSLAPEDESLLKSVVNAINSKMKVGCTGCRYCMPCPKKVDIPGTFAAYNRAFTEGKIRALVEYFMCTAARTESTAASNCVGCGLCEQHCPQHIEIRKELRNVQSLLENPIYKVGRAFVRKFKLF